MSADYCSFCDALTPCGPGGTGRVIVSAAGYIIICEDCQNNEKAFGERETGKRLTYHEAKAKGYLS